MEGLRVSMDFAKDFEFNELDPDTWLKFKLWVVQTFDYFYTWVTMMHGSLIGEDQYVTEYGTTDLNLTLLWAQTLKTLMEGLRVSMDFAKDFEFTAPDAETWSKFKLWVVQTFDYFYIWVTEYHGSLIDETPYTTEYGTDDLNLTLLWSQTLKTLMEGLNAAMLFAKNFEFSEPDPETWGNFKTWVQETFVYFYDWVNSTKSETLADGTVIQVPLFTEGGLTLVGQFSTALNSLMNGLKTALEVSLAFPKTGWVQPGDGTGTVGDPWYEFKEWVKGTFTEFYDWANATTVDPNTNEVIPRFDDAGLTLTGKFASALQSLMGGLKAALDMSLAFPTTEWKEPDVDDWDDFIGWVQKVFNKLYEYVTDPANFPQTENEADQFASVASFGTALNNVMGGLKNALSVFEELVGYLSPSEASIDLFLEDVTYIIGKIKTYSDTNFPTTESSEPMNSFATAMKNVFDGLKSGLALFKDLAGLSGTSEDFLASARPFNPDAPLPAGADDTFAIRMGMLFHAINYTLGKFGDFVDTNTFEWDDDAQALWDALDKVVTILKSALALFTSIESAGMPDTATIEAFIIAVKDVFTIFATEFGLIPGNVDTAGQDTFDKLEEWKVEWLTLTGPFEKAGQTLGKAFADGLSDVINSDDTHTKINTKLNDLMVWIESSSSAANNLTGMQKTGNDLGHEVMTGFGNAFSETYDLNKQLNTFQAWFGYNVTGSPLNQVSMNSVGYDIGAETMKGFGKGLKSVDLTGTIGGVTDDIKAAIKAAFGIASPSKVTMEYGQQIAQGLEMGILQGVPGVDNAMMNLTGGVGIGELGTIDAKRQSRFDIYIHGDVDYSTKQELKLFLSDELRRGAW